MYESLSRIQEPCTTCGDSQPFDRWTPKAAGTTRDMVNHPPRYTADGILMRAADLLRERGKAYDNGQERSMARAVDMFNIATDKGITEEQGWLLLQCVKIVREQTSHGFHQDSYEDDISYAALKAEAASYAALKAEAAAKWYGSENKLTENGNV